MEKKTGWLGDGMHVEVINEKTNIIGVVEYQIKPVGEASFGSGVNPWIPRYMLFPTNPQVKPQVERKL